MRWTLLATLAACLAAAGCTVNEVIEAEETELIVAEAPPDESLLLDIGVVEFAAGVPKGNETLQGTGHWGAVRVIPSRSAFTDIIISGAIEESDGEFVELDITVKDAAGRHWYDKTYETQTGVSSYSQNRDRRLDPYQKVFNDIANDLKAYVDQLPPGTINEIRQVSELQFFADMSPLAFGEHLAVDDDDITSIVRLPAGNDPSVARLRQIRERDRLVVDTLNEHYANFYYGIAIPYHSWRKTAREESINYRQVRRSATMQTLLGAVVLAGALSADTSDSNYRQARMKNSLQAIAIGESLETIIRGFNRRSEAQMHIESIRELSESFGAEAAPMVVTVEGQTRRLTGTAAAQYESWRRLLKQIYEAETGFVEADVDQDPVRIAEPSS
jgi:hypothetical protein